MAVQYYFDNLDPVTFQRLISAILNARFGQDVRFSPLRGKDGGMDAEIPLSVFSVELEIKTTPTRFLGVPLKPGRYIFQVKHHRMADRQGNAVRNAVITDFEHELKANVLPSLVGDRGNYFFLITNVPSSKEAIAKLEEKRRELLDGSRQLHADVLWQEQLIAWLDQVPRVWSAFPELFAGMKVPTLGQVADVNSQGLSRSIRMALKAQFARDRVVRFRQISLEHSLSRLFVDLEANVSSWRLTEQLDFLRQYTIHQDVQQQNIYWPGYSEGISAIGILVSETQRVNRLILEGGPGQGKSTITQMVAQLYRSLLLDAEEEYKNIWDNLPKARFPFRIELRLFAESLGTKDRSVEEYIADTFSRDAGGAQITVDDIQAIGEQQPIILICDGLDEVGSDELRDTVILKISDCVNRFAGHTDPDLHTIITSRPPAIAGRASQLPGFERAQLLPLSDSKVNDYVQRWTDATCDDRAERERVVESFTKRRSEQHVRALVKNPMQLSVLLHFIRLKGEAFPDRRAELYREYFKTVIDRDVEKSPQLRRHRDDIEALHEVIGFEVHSRAESDNAGSTLTRLQLISSVQQWLIAQGRKADVAHELFKLGEERLGLIVATSGEGTQTRYGFEVQPVREYFAAAFINDKWEANAHDLFQEMVRRSFWREVALFLAGLRRANEKADLVSRARALDRESDEGWRSDGRTIVLQLLQEGVLTSPGHVFSDAISFLLELLDPSRLTAYNQPKGMLSALPQLINGYDSPQPRLVLNSLLDKAQHQIDRGALWKLWRVASKTLSLEEIENYALEYDAGSRDDLAAQVKLLWPAQAALNFVDRPKWKNVVRLPPNRPWAESWFEAATVNDSVTGLENTAEYHELLFEQFAFQPLYDSRPVPEVGQFRPRHPFAIWNLCANMRNIARLIIGSPLDEASIKDSPKYDGLTEMTKKCASELLEASIIAIQKTQNGQSVNKAFVEFVELLERLVSEEGLISWLGCRCALMMMRYVNSPRYFVESNHYSVRAADNPLARMSAWVRLRKLLPPFFRSALPVDLTKGGRTVAPKILYSGLSQTVPSHVRINGEWRSLPEMLLAQTKQEQPPMIDWLERVPIPHYWIPELVLKSDNEFGIMPALAQRQVQLNGPLQRLKRSQVRSILRAVESSSDPQFCAGSLFALLGSPFWDVADSSLCLKMIEGDAKYLDCASRIFEDRSFSHSGSRSPRLEEVANLIVDNASMMSHATAAAAARFLVETKALKFPPLRSLLNEFPSMSTSS